MRIATTRHKAIKNGNQIEILAEIPNSVGYEDVPELKTEEGSEPEGMSTKILRLSRQVADDNKRIQKVRLQCEPDGVEFIMQVKTIVE